MKSNWRLRLLVLAAVFGLVPALASAAVIAPRAQVSIAANGQVIARSAVITGISGNTITVALSWGNAKMTWTIVTDGSTYFVPDGQRGAILKPGHTIDFSGMLSSTEGSMLVKATYVRDATILANASGLSGTVVDYDSSKDVLMLQTDDGTTSVKVGRGTIITSDGNWIPFSAIEPGTELSVSGNLNTLTKTINADRVTLVSAESADNVGLTSVLLSVLKWSSMPFSMLL